MAAIPTEPIGSIPRPVYLIEAIERAGDPLAPVLTPLYERAIEDTIRCFEETGSPVITDGEQRKYHNFWTYPLDGLPNMAADGFKIPFAAGHTRRMPRLVTGPFRYRVSADEYLDMALRFATKPVKQAVISPSALSLSTPPTAFPTIRASGSSTTCSPSTSEKSGAASTWARTPCRSISRRDGWR
jgi:5-methyltetrahydropteroyltriglutamate--homocysteine methyltransferase